MKIHDDSKSHKCDVCLKVFVSKSHLNMHYITHTGVKPFACEFCDRKYTQKYSLVQHQETHSENKSFKCSCSFCNHKSYTACSLKRHEKNQIVKET